MIPILIDTLNDSLTSNGKGKLSDIVSCVIHEELNGDYSATFEYPITGALYDEIQPGLSIQCICPRYDKTKGVVIDSQWFDIYKKETPIDGIVRFSCLHASRRLSGRVHTLAAISAEHPDYLTDATYYTPGGNLYGMYVRSLFVPWTTGLAYIEPKSVLAAMIGESGSLVSEFGGDFAFYTATDTNPYYRNVFCDWVQRRGSDKGAFVRYGINMTDFQNSVDYSGTYRYCCPFWDDGNGNRTFTVMKSVGGGGTTPIFREYCLPLDCSSVFATQPTNDQLVAYATQWLQDNTPWLPADTLEVDFTNGEVETGGADIALGDTVHIYWEDADVNATMRCVAYDYDVLEQKYSKLTLGKQQSQFVAVTGGGFAGASDIPTNQMQTVQYTGTFAAVGVVDTIQVLTKPVRYAFLLGLIYDTGSASLEISRFTPFFSTMPYVQFDSTGVVIKYAIQQASIAGTPLKAVVGYIE